ncbi:hypothetical protein VTJ04DRAFT_10220 [Mycothermus thermophilus]|uniref:uncharacterized protein n=1 Tax=Humicola insolens TaxID=85995 RepID=UPI003742B86D
MAKPAEQTQSSLPAQSPGPGPRLMAGPSNLELPQMPHNIPAKRPFDGSEAGIGGLRRHWPKQNNRKKVNQTTQPPPPL